MIETEPTIRLAGRQDLDAAADLVTGAFAQYRSVLPAHIFDPYMRDSCDFTSRLSHADVALLEAHGRLLGTVTYFADAAREGMGWPLGFAGLRTLAVAPWAQGHGYGRALCVWCITRARHEQARALVLHTAEFMTAARKLYEGLGFHRRPSHDLLASDVLRLSAGQVDQKIMGYALTIVQSGSGTSY